MADAVEQAKPDEQDQSMEEILQSIRKIIAEEDDDPKTEEPPQAAPETTDQPPGAAADAGSDVLELTSMVKEDGSVVDLKEETGTPPAPEKAEVKEEAPKEKAKEEEQEGSGEETKEERDVLQKIDTALAPPEPAAEPQPTPEAPPQSAAPEPVVPSKKPSMEDDTPLVSEDAAARAAASLKTLAEKTPKKPAPKVGAPAFRDGSTVEDLVVEAVRPMLKEWLDANLPELVEKIIRREVRRIADTSGD